MIQFNVGDRVVQGYSTSPVYEVTNIITLRSQGMRVIFECFALNTAVPKPSYFYINDLRAAP